VVVIDVAVKAVGGLGLVIITAPLPGVEYADVSYLFLADTLAQTLEPQSTKKGDPLITLDAIVQLVALTTDAKVPSQEAVSKYVTLSALAI